MKTFLDVILVIQTIASVLFVIMIYRRINTIKKKAFRDGQIDAVKQIYGDEYVTIITDREDCSNVINVDFSINKDLEGIILDSKCKETTNEEHGSM